MPIDSNSEKKKFVPWQRALQNVIDKNNHLRQNGRQIASNRTMELRAQVIFKGFRDLRELGYKIEDPLNFKPKHMTALAMHWEEKGLSSATIQNQISFFRLFTQWIGKPGMIGASELYVKAKATVTRHYAAEKDKSWSTNTVDFNEQLVRVAREDVYVAIQLRVIHAFGLRLREAVMLRPNSVDKGGYLAIEQGAKNGRARILPIDTEYKRDVIEEARKFARTPNGHIGNPELNLAQNQKRFSKIMTKLGLTQKKLGVTAHGLRHQYINDLLEESTGCKTPVRGGNPEDWKGEKNERAIRNAMEQAGHLRTSIGKAYYGDTSPPAKSTKGALPETDGEPATMEAIAEGSDEK